MSSMSTVTSRCLKLLILIITLVSIMKIYLLTPAPTPTSIEVQEMSPSKVLLAELKNLRRGNEDELKTTSSGDSHKLHRLEDLFPDLEDTTKPTEVPTKSLKDHHFEVNKPIWADVNPYKFHQAAPVDYCQSDTCENGGTCREFADEIRCDCAPGWEGTRCEKNINECASSPCMNFGSCKDLINGYQCSCIRGFTGLRCEIDLDDCDPNPCDHYGVCVDIGNSFMCHCRDGFSGRTCDKNNVLSTYDEATKFYVFRPLEGSSYMSARTQFMNVAGMVKNIPNTILVINPLHVIPYFDTNYLFNVMAKNINLRYIEDFSFLLDTPVKQFSEILDSAKLDDELLSMIDPLTDPIPMLKDAPMKYDLQYDDDLFGLYKKLGNSSAESESWRTLILDDISCENGVVCPTRDMVCEKGSLCRQAFLAIHPGRTVKLITEKITEYLQANRTGEYMCAHMDLRVCDDSETMGDTEQCIIEKTTQLISVVKDYIEKNAAKLKEGSPIYFITQANLTTELADVIKTKIDKDFPLILEQDLPEFDIPPLVLKSSKSSTNTAVNVVLDGGMKPPPVIPNTSPQGQKEIPTQNKGPIRLPTKVVDDRKQVKPFKPITAGADPAFDPKGGRKRSYAMEGSSEETPTSTSTPSPTPAMVYPAIMKKNMFPNWFDPNYIPSDLPNDQLYFSAGWESCRKATVVFGQPNTEFMQNMRIQVDIGPIRNAVLVLDDDEIPRPTVPKPTQSPTAKPTEKPTPTSRPTDALPNDSEDSIEKSKDKLLLTEDNLKVQQAEEQQVVSSTEEEIGKDFDEVAEEPNLNENHDFNLKIDTELEVEPTTVALDSEPITVLDEDHGNNDNNVFHDDFNLETETETDQDADELEAETALEQ